MDLEQQSALKKAISEVLETMFFTGVDFMSDGAPHQIFNHESMICLSNQARLIELHLRTTEAFARTITANLLGVDEEGVNREDLEDTMKELANMVGGNFQGRLKDSEWQLGIPCYEGLAAGVVQRETGLFFSCFDEPVGMVTWRLEPRS